VLVQLVTGTLLVRIPHQVVVVVVHLVLVLMVEVELSL
jgi:hypothetical protein